MMSPLFPPHAIKVQMIGTCKKGVLTQILELPLLWYRFILMSDGVTVSGYVVKTAGPDLPDYYSQSWR
jgi:hypothetical protein